MKLRILRYKYKRAASLALAFVFAAANPALADVGYPVPQNLDSGVSVNQSADIYQIKHQGASGRVFDNEWSSFDVPTGGTVDFNFSNSGQVSLNRVVGNQASQILGRITESGAGGKVFLINPHGVMFGNNAMVNVSSLLVSTAKLTNKDIDSMKFEFTQGAGSGNIVNEGSIKVSDTGFVAMLAPVVDNKGVIEAKKGTVALVSGGKYTLTMEDGNKIHVKTDEKLTKELLKDDKVYSLVNNEGQIVSDGGYVFLSAKAAEDILANAVNHSGIIVANTVKEENGELVFGNVELDGVNSDVIATGYIGATGEKGGNIKVLGKGVIVDGFSTIDASGIKGGGEILIGGDYQGNGDIRTSDFTYVGPFAYLAADAVLEGNGGKVIVWSDEDTYYYGDIAARGGLLSGDGGFAEVSGKEYLDFYGWADLTAANGNRGQLLLDPDDILITSFDPTDIAGLQLWLDASDLSTITKDGSNYVSQWNDKSGNGNNANQANATYRPIYEAADQSVNFNADYMVFPEITAKAGIFIVRNVNGSNANAGVTPLVGKDTQTQHYIFLGLPSFAAYEISLDGLIGDTGDASINGGNLLPGNGTGTNINFPELTGFPVHNDPDIAYWQINTARTWNTIAAFTNNSSTFLGKLDISEAMLFTDKLSTENRQLLEQYQAVKWGIDLETPLSSYSQITESYLEALSQTTDISLQANNNIELASFDDGILSLGGNASITFNAGNQIIMDTSDTILTEGGDITFTAGNGMTLGNLNTTGTSGIETGGDITLTSTNGNISTNDVTFRNANLDITANNGSISLNNIVTSTILDFDPTSIAGMQLWLDASDLSTITMDGSNYVSQWDDKSGNGNDATQTNATYRPIYDDTNISINFNEDYINIPNVSAKAGIFIINNIEAGSNADWLTALIGSASGHSYFLLVVDPAVGYDVSLDGYASLYDTGDISINGNSLLPGDGSGKNIDYPGISGFTNKDDSDILYWQINDLREWNYIAKFIHSEGTYIGNFDINEAMLFTDKLSTENRQLLEQYQAAKWGIDLPSGPINTTPTINLTAGNNIDIGDQASGLIDLPTGTTLTMNAGGAITMADTTDTIRTEGTALNFTSGSGMTLGNLDTTGAAGIKSAEITLLSDYNNNNDGTLTLNGTLTSGGSDITLTGARVDINNTVNAGTGSVTIKPTTAKTIQFAGSTENADSATILDISSQEMGRITADTLSIGDSTLAGDINIVGNFDLSGLNTGAGVYDLEFNTGGGFNNTGRTISLGRDALYFDGSDDYVTMGDVLDMGLSDWTTSVWVKTADSDFSLISKSFYGFVNNRWATVQETGGLFSLFQGTRITNTAKIASVADDEWHNVTVVYDRDGNNSMYVDGVFKNSANMSSQSGQNLNSTALLLLGIYNNVAGNGPHPTTVKLQGCMDDVNVYNTALTPSEITALYNSGAGKIVNSADNGLVGAWHFNEGAGITVDDTSSNNFVGTLMQGPVWTFGKDLAINAAGSVNTGNITGDGSDIAINAGSVTFDGNLVTTGNGTVQVISTNDITINNGKSIQAGGSGDAIVLASTTGNFMNYSDGTALSTPNGRWLVYSGHPDDTTEGITTYSKRYNTTYPAAAPVDANNYFLYRVNPTLTITADPISKIYGSANPALTYTVSGLIDGDSFEDATDGSASITTTANDTSPVNTYAITSAAGTLTANMGYNIGAYNNGTLTITAKQLTASLTGAVSKQYDGNTDATLALANYNLPGILAGDTVTLANYATGSYDTPNAGTGKTVSVNGLTLAGAGAGNYTLASANINGNIGEITALPVVENSTEATAENPDIQAAERVQLQNMEKVARASQDSGYFQQASEKLAVNSDESTTQTETTYKIVEVKYEQAEKPAAVNEINPKHIREIPPDFDTSLYKFISALLIK